MARSTKAEARFTRSLRLSPSDPSQRFAAEGLAKVHRIRENYAESLAWACRAHALSPGLSGCYWHMISANAHLGRMDAAERQLARYLRVSPGVTINSIRAGQHFADVSRLSSMLSGLRLAGLPER